jgi:hypothetical protein
MRQAPPTRPLSPLRRARMESVALELAGVDLYSYDALSLHFVGEGRRFGEPGQGWTRKQLDLALDDLAERGAITITPTSRTIQIATVEEGLQAIIENLGATAATA